LTKNNLVKWWAVKLGTSPWCCIEKLDGERTTMNNVFNILDARKNKVIREFTDGLDRVWQSTIAKYSADRDDPR
jgi:hypothetical protein